MMKAYKEISKSTNRDRGEKINLKPQRFSKKLQKHTNGGSFFLVSCIDVKGVVLHQITLTP